VVKTSRRSLACACVCLCLTLLSLAVPARESGLLSTCLVRLCLSVCLCVCVCLCLSLFARLVYPLMRSCRVALVFVLLVHWGFFWGGVVNLGYEHFQGQAFDPEVQPEVCVFASTHAHTQVLSVANRCMCVCVHIYLVCVSERADGSGNICRKRKRPSFQTRNLAPPSGRLLSLSLSLSRARARALSNVCVCVDACQAH